LVTSRTERLIAIACAVAIVLIFTSFNLVSRIGTRSTLGVADVAALRFGIGGLVMLPFCVRFGLQGLTFPRALALTATGGLGFALSAYVGFSLAPAAHAAIFLHGVMPFFTALMAAIILGELSHRLAALGHGFIIAGVAGMAWEVSHAVYADQITGDGFFMLASLLWACYTSLVHRFNVPALQAASLVAVFSMLVYLPVYFFFLEKQLFTAALSDIVIQGAYQGIVVGALSILIFTRAVNSLGPARTGLFIASVPALTTFGAATFLGETPSVVSIGFLVLVTLGMILAIEGSRSRWSVARKTLNH
jgi:drug/metabolite transporter (DMT)-like permease